MMLAAAAFGASLLLTVSPHIVNAVRRRTRLPAYVQAVRAVYSTALVYRVAIADEVAPVPTVTVSGMRPLGGVATVALGRPYVSRYVVDETGTIVATRHGESLYIFSIAGRTAFETICTTLGLPCGSPDVDRQWFPLRATDSEMLAAHRARIARASEPLVRIATIEQLGELQTALSQRGAEWRAAQDDDELFDADLRSILGEGREGRARKLKQKLARPPRASVVRRS